ncbi:MAG: hypothetical protein ACRDZ8_04180 [Acidimicrobiales bacterium]
MAALAAAGGLAVLGAGGPAMASGLGSQATPASATFAAQAYAPLRVTAAHRVTADDPVPSRGFLGPAMLIDPSNPKVMFAATVEARTRVCYLLRSTDGGSTWSTLANLPTLSSYPFCFNTSGGVTQSPIAFGRNHALYYALVGYSNQDGGADSKADISVEVAKSTDLGNTWTTVLVENARGKTGTATESNYPVASVAVDTSGPQDVVVTGWRQGHPQQPTAVSNSLIGISTDGGANYSQVNLNNFSTLTLTNAGTSYKGTFSTPHVAAGDGVIYAGTSVSYPTAAKAPSQPYYVGYSTNHGQSFTMVPVTPAGAGGQVLSWSPLGGPQGTALLVYSYEPNVTQGNTDIYFQRSTDGGKTWSAPAKLNDDDPSLSITHGLPNINVAPNGRIDVAWDDFRNAQSFADDIYYTYSTDDGMTWAHNIRASDQVINLNIGISNNSDVRQPPGIGSANNAAVFGWADTRLGNQTTQTQDVFASVVQFKPITTGGSNTVKYFTAGAIGLVVAGLIVLIIALSRRRKGSPGAPPPVAREREPVGVA